MFTLPWTTAIYERLRYAWAFVKATYRIYFLQRFANPMPMMVYKVVAVNEDTETEQNVTRLFRPGAWEASVRLATGWTSKNIRADVRYLSEGRKYRVILRPGEAWSLPDGPTRYRGGPKGVMSASMHGDGRAVNVTARVLKYQGPLKDFHHSLGHRVGVMDMFPLDDLDELYQNFEFIRIIDAHAHMFDIPVDCDDVANACKI